MIQLPLAFPEINGYTDYAVLFSALLAHEECTPWIYSNFIQVYSLKDLFKNKSRSGTLSFFYNLYGDWMLFELKANPWIKYNSVSYDFAFNQKIDFIHAIKHSLDTNKYVILTIDMFYIPAYSAYKKKHRAHKLFVTGYDETEEQFFAFDNFSGAYEHHTVAFHEVAESVNHLYQTLEKGEDEEFIAEVGEPALVTFEVVKNTEKGGQEEIFRLNIPKIVNDLKEYLKHKNYGDDYYNSDFYVFGIDCYEELEKFIDYCIIEQKKIDHRAFYAFYDHKKLMLMRIKYLNKTVDMGSLMGGYEEIVKRMLQVVNLLIKYNITQNVNTLKKIKKHLQEIQSAERSILEECTNTLQTFCELHSDPKKDRLKQNLGITRA